MEGRTHAAIGVAAGLLLASTMSADPVNTVGLAAISGVAALFPDIDSPESKISRRAGPVRGLFAGVSHRGLTHSLVALALLLLIIPLSFNLFVVVFIGYASHLLADSMTKVGIPLLWPKAQYVHLLPKGYRLTTGGQIETLIFLLVSLGSIVMVVRMF